MFTTIAQSMDSAKRRCPYLFTKDISMETFLSGESNYIPVDVRSPSEYAEATIPGAINIPLFTDEERALVGTTYKEKGQNEAKWLGMELVSPKLPVMLRQLKDLMGEGKLPVLFCWRGGMRSMSTATFARFSGLAVSRLTGGYREYRRTILNLLNESLLPEKTFVLHGMTGVGKTLILDQLREWKEPVIDLESFAGHRGSVFGSIGLEEKNQKAFDSLLFQGLWELKQESRPYMFIEAESRRIGRIVLPNFLLEAKKNGTHFLISAPLEIRVDRICEDYITPYEKEEWFLNRVHEAFRTIAPRMETSVRNDCYRYLMEKKYRLFIRTLLSNYYDPRYSFKKDEYPCEFIEIDATDIESAARQIKEAAFVSSGF